LTHQGGQELRPGRPLRDVLPKAVSLLEQRGGLPSALQVGLQAQGDELVLEQVVPGPLVSLLAVRSRGEGLEPLAQLVQPREPLLPAP
jgi:hypothetical protein